MKDLIWVSCSQEDDWATSRHRHLINAEHKGLPGATTMCGSTQATGKEFRGSTVKPACETCLEKMYELYPIERPLR